MNKYNPNEKLDKEQEDALEFYMKKCSRLEEEVERLKERVDRLVWQRCHTIIWQLEEND